MLSKNIILGFVFQEISQDNYNILLMMFDLDRQNYLIPIPSIQTKGRTSNQLGNQNLKHLAETENQNNEANKHGKWAFRQRMRYLLFLQQKQALFADTQTRKKQKIFSQMSKHIKSRKTGQCKSHHQKVLKIHKNVENIIRHLRRNLGDLKEEWRQFIRTEERVLFNSFTQFNKNQVFYRVIQFSDVVKIEIDASYIESYL